MDEKRLIPITRPEQCCHRQKESECCAHPAVTDAVEKARSSTPIYMVGHAICHDYDEEEGDCVFPSWCPLQVEAPTGVEEVIRKIQQVAAVAVNTTSGKLKGDAANALRHVLTLAGAHFKPKEKTDD